MSKQEIEKHLPIMKAMIRMTKDDGKEYGFVLCDGWHMIPGEGSHDMVFIGSCPIEEDTTLSFHTHPSGSTYPSREDIETWRRRNVKIACIGTQKEIRCFI